jgi:hypothetical protein
MNPLDWNINTISWIFVTLVILMILGWVGYVGIYVAGILMGIVQSVRDERAMKSIPALTGDELQSFSEDVFREICRRTTAKDQAINFVEYYFQRGLAFRKYYDDIIAPLFDEGWIEETDTHMWYVLTDAGWLERQVRRMGELDPRIDIKQDFRGASSVHGGAWNIASRGSASSADWDMSPSDERVLLALVDALRADAESASSSRERERAETYASQLDEALVNEDTKTAGTLVERVKGFLDLANSGFALSHQIIRQFFAES